MNKWVTNAKDNTDNALGSYQGLKNRKLSLPVVLGEMTTPSAERGFSYASPAEKNQATERWKEAKEGRGVCYRSIGRLVVNLIRPSLLLMC